MTDSELRRLAEAATQGPWIAGDDEDSDYFLVGPHDGDEIVFRPVVKLHAQNNAEYIAAANPSAILDLLDRLEKAEKAALSAKQGEQEAVIHQHGFAKENSTLRTINESLDQQLDEVMRERDERDDVIDKLLDIVLGADRYEWSSHYGFTDAIAEVEERMAHPAPVNQQLLEALKTAEAALSDIGDADREPGDDGAWCEARAAQALPKTRAAIAEVEASRG